MLKLKASTRSQIEMVEDGGGSGALLPERHPRSDESPSEDVLSKSPALSARMSALQTPSRAGTSLTALEPEVSSLSKHLTNCVGRERVYPMGKCHQAS